VPEDDVDMDSYSLTECLRIFTRFPQTSRVFFGGESRVRALHIGIDLAVHSGGHDNGYTSTLSHLENEGLLKKIILLRGYQTLAAELQHFDLHQLHLEGVFMANKLPSNHKKTHTTSSIGMRAPENDKSHHLSQEFYPATLSGSATPGKNRPFLRYLDPSLVRTFHTSDKSQTDIPAQPLNKSSLLCVHPVSLH
jgi:hypothetical protein